MSFSSDDLARIDAAISRGELTVDFGDRRVTYRSIDELIKAKNHILGTSALSETTGRPRQFQAVAGKGFDSCR